jgi:hypothetical protein
VKNYEYGKQGISAKHHGLHGGVHQLRQQLVKIAPHPRFNPFKHMNKIITTNSCLFLLYNVCRLHVPPVVHCPNFHLNPAPTKLVKFKQQKMALLAAAGQQQQFRCCSG